MDQEARDRIDTMEKCRKRGEITKNGVVYDWWLVNADGAGFMLFREPQHTDADIEAAKAYLISDRDVVGRIRVQTIERDAMPG